MPRRSSHKVPEILIWQEAETWWPFLIEAIGAVRHRDRVRAAPRESVVDLMTASLREHFAEVRLFHACRPSDIGAYYREGIRRHDAFVLDRARAIYSAQGIPMDTIEAAIADTDLELDKDRVFLALDDRLLIDSAGHYMIYGSESVMSVGAALIRLGHYDAQRRLMTIGQPILFTCDVPLSLLREHSIREVAESLYDEYRICRGRRPHSPSRRDHTVVVKNDIPAAAIRGHSTPQLIRDWHQNGLPYRYVSSVDRPGESEMSRDVADTGRSLTDQRKAELTHAESRAKGGP